MKRLIALLLLFPLIGAVSPVLGQYVVGDSVENFTLPDTSGSQVSLYDYRDRIVVLPFWDPL